MEERSIHPPKADNGIHTTYVKHKKSQTHKGLIIFSPQQRKEEELVESKVYIWTVAIL